MARPSKVQLTGEVLSLIATTVILLGVFVTNGLAGSSDATTFGFKNTTGDISDLFFTQVTPAGYTFAIWGVIYTWQALWIIYAWSFTCRPNTQRTIFTGVYIGYSLVSICNITWIYVWGNEHIVASCVILFLYNIFFYPTIGLLFGYFYIIQDEVNRVDLWLTRALPMNGLCFYATWTTIASLINLAAALNDTTSVSIADCGTISLTLLLLVVLLYFTLENTILDRYGFRYVLSVYPVVIWALIGVLVAQWGDDGAERNNIYTLVLLVLTGVLFTVRLVLVGLFAKFCPRKGYQSVESSKEPTKV